MGPYRAVAPLVLASGSPRRRELLASAGVAALVRAPSVDETLGPDEACDAYLERIVDAKLAAARALAGASAVLVADTVVVADGRILGKPRDAADARAMVASLVGRTHEVATRFALWSPRGVDARTVRTRVVVRALDDATIDAYVATGEGLDKAGAYAIQGRFAFAVERIEGSYTNVVGLPLAEVIEALVRAELVAPVP